MMITGTAGLTVLSFSRAWIPDIFTIRTSISTRS